MGITEEMENIEPKVNKKKKRWIGVLIKSTVLLIVVFAVFLIIYTFKNKTYDAYEVAYSTQRIDSNTVRYMKYGKNLLKYSRDGASAIDKKGKEIWNGTYNMKSPEVAICDDYVAIADIGEDKVVVFDGSGNRAEIDAILPIIKVRVARQGVVVLLLEDVDGNKITFNNPFNTSKKLLYEMKTFSKDHGYPVDIDLSQDGKKLVTSYLNIKNNIADNTINFYNFSEVGDNTENNLMGFFPYKQILVPKVEFVTNDVVCAYGENQFTLYAMKERPSIILKEQFDNSIRSIFSDSKHVGFILENLEGTEKYRVKVYNIKGKQVLDTTIDYDYQNVNIYGEDIVFYTQQECNIIRLNGTEKFKHRFDKSISYIFPSNVFNRYIVIDKSKIEEIIIKGAKKE